MTGHLKELLRAAAVQMCSGADVEENLHQAGQLAEKAVNEGAELVLLPENFAFLTTRDADKLKLQGDAARQIQTFVVDLASQLGATLVAGAVPVYEEGDDRPWSRSLVAGPDGKLLGGYNKMHLFDVDVPDSEEHYRESGCTRPGESTECVAAAGTCLGLSICYDLRFPELYRELTKQGAEVLTVPAAFTERTGEAHWELLLRARAVENLAFVIGAGQTGEHPGGRRTWGHSMIVDPWGEILAHAGRQPGFIIADLALNEQRKLRECFPALDHRRL